MDYQGTHIRFERQPALANRKTTIWTVRSKHQPGSLGEIKWWGPWRKYCFLPADLCVFEEVCMREISQFIVDRTTEHRTAMRDQLPNQGSKSAKPVELQACDLQNTGTKSDSYPVAAGGFEPPTKGL